MFRCDTGGDINAVFHNRGEKEKRQIMPRGKETVPAGGVAGKGKGIGVGRGGRGRGQMGGNRKRTGPGGNCLCPNCGEKLPHQVGKPCYEMKCPKCGTLMIRE